MTLPRRLVCVLFALGCSGEITPSSPDAARDVSLSLDAADDTPEALAPDAPIEDLESAPDVSVPDASAPDASAPDAPVADVSAPDAPAACGTCALWGEAANLGAIRSTSLVELSGIAASRRTPGVYYVQNDSGDSARFFAVRAATGAVEAEFHLTGTGARAVDWEDLAVAPCAAGQCLYIADIGDNDLARTEYALYRVAEPEITAGVHNIAFERFPFVYPDGRHNAETLLVVPSSGAVYVVTKTDVGNSTVFRFPSPLRAGERATLVRVADIHSPSASPLFTGGSVHPCTQQFLLRTYNRLYLYTAPAGMDFEAAFRVRPESVSVATESQGEGVGFTPDGSGYVTVSEGANPVIHGVGCM